MNRSRFDRVVGSPRIPDDVRSRLDEDSRAFATAGLPPNLPEYVRERYRIDMTGRYAGVPIPMPFGKGSGQLTMKAGQIAEAAAGQLGFAVLKTVIAQDEQGARTMGAWTVHAPRMAAERIQGKTSGKSGWTISWRGRGWSESFEEYLRLVEDSLRISAETGLVVAPSVKYHLPTDEPWRVEEYVHTTRALLDARDRAGVGDGPLLLEKDFSPTLAGSSLARTREIILNWLTRVTDLIREAAAGRPIRIGLKLMNAMDDIDFQVEMLRVVHALESPPDFLIVGNRLFDPDREFDGLRGIAYGGPDLSDRNLETLGRFLREPRPRRIEISGTGDISSGRIAVEYALRGCASFQIHTGFQLPLDEYRMTVGTRVERTIHRLLFDPEEGFIAWMTDVGHAMGLERDGLIRLTDLAAL